MTLRQTAHRSATGDPNPAGARSALQRAVEHLKGLQDPAGWWKGELETNVTMDAEDVLMREFLGIRTADETGEAARWIRSHQRPDGTWATYYGGPGDLSTTVEAYVALRLAGDDPAAPHMRAAAAFVVSEGGVEASRVFTRLWLALFGWWSWDALPSLPPEVMLLGPRIPLNVYDFACWARQTVVALTVVGTHRPLRPVGFGIDELRTGRPAAGPAGARPGLRTRAARWALLDRALAAYGRVPVRLNPLRRLALHRAERWILHRQEADGSWGGIQPPWVYSILALHLQGYPLDHPALRAGLEGLEGFTIHDERGRHLEACQSPVWDTALAVVALADAGLADGDPVLTRAVDWLVDEEITVLGDWAVRRPGLAPSGWAFEFANDNYPDVDDTAEVVMALARAETGGARAAARRRGRVWTEGMQSRDGGWGAFDADNVRQMCRHLPFCDFGEVIDPPSADVTAHVVEMLAQDPDSDPAVLARGVSWLWNHQEADGSWFGRWGANHVYGTGAVVPALVAAGVASDDGRIRRAVRWLEDHQNPDGGFGEDLRSYRDPAWIGRGASTPSQTAWALLALVAAGQRGEAAERAGQWLVDNQRPDGTWDEDLYTGTGFPADFYINYHLYRLVFPIMALGRWVTGEQGERSEQREQSAPSETGALSTQSTQGAATRKLVLAGPRSFCAGVERAIEIVERALERRGAPVYVRRQIVHNAHVVADLESRGAVFVHELDEVPAGSTVVLSAHGVAPAVRQDARDRGLSVIDATCPLVAKVHTEARRFANQGRTVVLIGHAGHDEVEGTLGEVPGTVVVGSVADVAGLDLDPATPVALLNQTTLAPDDVVDVAAAVRARFASVVEPAAGDICYATQNRQDAVRAIAGDVDVVLVVGSANSSNSNRLVEVAERCGVPAHLLEDESGLDPAWLEGTRAVGITAGASTPESLVERVVSAIAGLGPVERSEHPVTEEHVRFPLPHEVR